MRRAIGLLAFLALLWPTPAAQADPVKSELSGSSPARVSSNLSHYVPTIRGRTRRASWAERHLRQLADPDARGQVTVANVLRPQQPDADTPPDPTQGLNAELASVLASLGPGGRGGGEGGEGFTAPDSLAGEGSLAAITESLVDGAVNELPGFAFDVVDALYSFSDNALNMVFELKASVAGKTFDWTSFFKNRRELQSDRTKKTQSRKLHKYDPDAEARARIQAKLERMRFRKVVRSLFKILLGVGIGLFFWLIVRRTF